MNKLLSEGEHYPVTVRQLRKIAYDKFNIVPRMDEDIALERQGEKATFFPTDDKVTKVELPTDTEEKNPADIEEKTQSSTLRDYLKSCFTPTKIISKLKNPPINGR